MSLIWIRFIFEILKFLVDLRKKEKFYPIITLLLVVSVGGLYVAAFHLIKKDQDKLSLYDSETINDEVKSKIKKALVDCGDLSFATWIVLEDIASSHGKYLRFKTVHSCDKDRTRFEKPSEFKCIVDIKLNNPIYLRKHFINKETLAFIESDPKLPSGAYFEELTPVWFSLIDKNGKDSKEAEFLKVREGINQWH